VNSESIGIFDSGLGGLTVMNAITALLPNENIIYFGDTDNLPYGNKSEETILRHCQENILFLKNLGVKLIVIACHTASITSYKLLEDDPTIINMVEPSLSLLKQSPKIGHTILLGTKKTIDSGVYQKLILDQAPKRTLTSISCPLFVPLVEEGYSEHSIAKVVTKNYLSPLKNKTADSLLLGCTHYPLLQKTIKKALSFPINLIDPSNECANLVKSTLEEKKLLNKENKPPLYQFFVSNNPERFLSRAKELLNYPIDHVFLTNSTLEKVVLSHSI
jgi:glutamate racemase